MAREENLHWIARENFSWADRCKNATEQEDERCNSWNLTTF